MKRNAKNHESPAASAEERHLVALSSFSHLYWFLVACVSAVILLSVVVAVVWKVSLGLLFGIAAAVLYEYFKRDAFRTHLGMRAKTVRGGLSVSTLHAKGEDVLYLPETVAGWRILELGEGALDSDGNANLRILYLPVSLERIGKDAFGGCPSLREIRFAGSKEAFEKIRCDTDLFGLTLSFDAEYGKISPLSDEENRFAEAPDFSYEQNEDSKR